ncbi:MAG: hypothetical protein ACJAU6_004112 [Alphaproteobacteria bacterium]
MHYDKKGNVTGVVEKKIGPKQKLQRKAPTRRGKGATAPADGCARRSTGAAEPREVLVSNPPRALLPRLQSQGYQVVERLILQNLGVEYLRLRAPRGTTADEAISTIQRQFPGVLVDKNTLFKISAGQSVRGVYANDITDWGLAPEKCGRGLTIGMIDTAFNKRNLIFRNRNIIFRSFTKKGRKVGYANHGATVAALLVGKPQNGVPGGLLPGATLFAASIFENRGGKLRGNLSSMLKALDWLVKERVPVVNLSMAGSNNKVLKQIIGKALAKGMILVAAAGNNGPRAKPAFPAANPKVIAVTAIDKNLAAYRHANRGGYIDFAAPGVGLQVTTTTRGKLKSGTSFAAPYITSMIAMQIAKGVPAKPNALRASLRKLTKDLGSPGRDETYGWGLVRYKPKC